MVGCVLGPERKAYGFILTGIVGQQNVRVERVGNVVNIVQVYACHAETIIYGVKGQLIGGERYGTFAVLDVRKALFFSCGQQLPVLDKDGRGVMKHGVNSECIHVEMGLLDYCVGV
jgi:hypothetical protein